MVSLHHLQPKKGSRKRRVVIGRGDSSGHGSYSGRGRKGQKSRTGGRKGLKRLGMRQLIAQTPKLGGFKSHAISMNTISLDTLEKHFQDGDVVSPAVLSLNAPFSAKHRGVKVLGGKKLTKKLEVRAHDFSISARKAIVEAGGKAIIIPLSKKR